MQFIYTPIVHTIPGAVNHKFQLPALLILVGTVDLATAIRRLEDRVADHGVAISVYKVSADGRDLFVVHNAVEQMCDLVHKGMFPADHMPLRPPVFPPGVIGLGNEHVAEALGLFWFVANPVDLELVEPL